MFRSYDTGKDRDSKRRHRNESWSKYAEEYDPIKCASIDATDVEPHDNSVIRAINSSYKPNNDIQGEPANIIFIGRLHSKTTEETLRKSFEKHGKIKNCRIVRDIVTGQSKRYAFIEFDKHSSAQNAVHKKEEVIIDNSEVIINYECQRTMKGWRPRRLGGGFGGRKESGQLKFGGRAKPFQKPLNVRINYNLEELYRTKKIIRNSKHQRK